MQRREDRQTGKDRESETKSGTEVTRYWLVSVFPKIDFIPGTQVVEEMSEAAAAGDGGAMCKDDERAATGSTRPSRRNARARARTQQVAAVQRPCGPNHRRGGGRQVAGGAGEGRQGDQPQRRAVF